MLFASVILKDEFFPFHLCLEIRQKRNLFSANLIEQAEKAMDAYEPLLAIKFLERALELDDKNARLLEGLGICHLETLNLDNPEINPIERINKAKEYFMKAIEYCPESSHGKYLHMGQLCSGKEAIAYYERALKIISSIVPNQPPEQLKMLQQQYSGALCSMTEIYMTDCCDEPDAEEKCVEYMKEAIQQDSTNPEVYQTFASVRLSQSLVEEAKNLLLTGMNLWFKDSPDLTVDPNWPPYPSRMALVRLLIEVGLHDEALAVLQTCQMENDEDAEVWYLFGWCYYQQSLETVDERADLLNDAKECLESLLQVSCIDVVE